MGGNHYLFLNAGGCGWLSVCAHECVFDMHNFPTSHFGTHMHAQMTNVHTNFFPPRPVLSPCTSKPWSNRIRPPWLVNWGHDPCPDHRGEGRLKGEARFRGGYIWKWQTERTPEGDMDNWRGRGVMACLWRYVTVSHLSLASVHSLREKVKKWGKAMKKKEKGDKGRKAGNRKPCLSRRMDTLLLESIFLCCCLSSISNAVFLLFSRGLNGFSQRRKKRCAQAWVKNQNRNRQMFHSVWSLPWQRDVSHNIAAATWNTAFPKSQS